MWQNRVSHPYSYNLLHAYTSNTQNYIISYLIL